MLTRTPVFIQERRYLFDMAYPLGAPSDIEGVILGAYDFMNQNVPYYNKHIVNPNKALESGTSSCIGRALLIHALHAPIDTMEPFLQLKIIDGGSAHPNRRVHAANYLVSMESEDVYRIDNDWDDFEEAADVKPQSAEGDATLEIVRSSAQLYNPERSQRERIEKILVQRSIESSLQSNWQQWSESYDQVNADDSVTTTTYVLVAREWSNLLVDSASKSAESHQHTKVKNWLKNLLVRGIDIDTIE